MKNIPKTIQSLQKDWRDPYVQWYAAGMPAFSQKAKGPFKELIVKFKTKEDRKHFSDLLSADLTENTNSISYPLKEREPNMTKRYILEDPDNPERYKTKYPIYIISKGRASYGPHTARALHNMGVHFYIVVEPQDVESYSKSPYFTKEQILVLPFSNHGKGSGPARNWCWEHSKANGHKRHWLMDDNMQEFWRLHKNKRYRVDKGSAPFRSTEDFVDRFENVALAGLQYKFFAVDKNDYHPFILNTRIMSCFLIDNDCPLRWRGRYNEDVDLSIRALKEGYVTMLFYSFLCGKLKTGTVKGGNTTEIYNNYADNSALKKSQMLYEMHPDCVEIMERYGRMHHFVNLDKIMTVNGTPARQNIPILKPGAKMLNMVDNYGMILVEQFGTPEQKHNPEFDGPDYPEGRKAIHE